MRTLFLSNDLFNIFDSDYSYLKRKNKNINFKEKEDCFEFYASLAGFKKEEVSAKTEEGIVYIVAENESDATSYSFSLPEETDASSLSAKYENGLLTVKVPKVEKAKPKTILIN